MHVSKFGGDERDMRILIAEDDMVSRRFLFEFLSGYGECDMAADGLEALEAFLRSLRDNKPYDLICLDIMMPKVDGVKALKHIRDLEIRRGILPEKRVRIIMTTALAKSQLVQKAFEIGCDAYAAKPVVTAGFIDILKKLDLIKQED